MFSARSLSVSLAWWYCFSKSANCSAVSTFLATTSVRRPSRAMLEHSSSSQSLYSTISDMTVSAPFMMKEISSVVSSLTMMPMRFVSEVKGNRCRIWKLLVIPFSSSSCMEVRSRKASFTPTCSVHCTRAT